jgi:hypothetical protein
VTRRPFILAVAIAAGGCAAQPQPMAASAPEASDWRTLATGSDRERLREWRSTFVRALQSARAAGHGSTIDAEGALLDPDAAIPGGALPVGFYQCRVIKVGARQQGLLDYIAYPPFRCQVTGSGPLQSLAKLTGSQRQVGTIHPADPMRRVFLGTLVLGDETRAMRYGLDPDRDLAGWVERIGPARWRLLLPEPRYESQLDVLELVPIPAGVR